MIQSTTTRTSDNWALWQDSPFHFVGSLPVSDYPDLMEIPLTSYEPLAEVVYFNLAVIESNG
jgi:hypothetical protein